MVKLKPKADDSGLIVGYVFQCPGCMHAHIFYVTGSVAWAFNGDMESPTFTPSLLNTCDHHPDPRQRRCHLNLTAGKLVFHGDCSHGSAGKTVELPEYPY
jgi:hypothetical protein